MQVRASVRGKGWPAASWFDARGDTLDDRGRLSIGARAELFTGTGGRPTRLRTDNVCG